MCPLYSTDDANHKNFRANLLRMQENDDFTDVTIKIGSSSIPCHRIVLSAATPYFDAMFSSDFKETSSPEVGLQGLNASAVSSLIKFMYTGEMEITLKNAYDLIPACEIFQFGQLIAECEKQLVRNIEPSNCIGLNSFAKLHNLTNLGDNSRECMLTQFESIIICKEFIGMTEEEVIDYISDENLALSSWDVVFEAIIGWTYAKFETRRKSFPEIAQCMKFSLCSSEYLRNVIREESLMETVECQKLLVDALLSQPDPSLNNPVLLHTPSERLVIIGGYLDSGEINDQSWCLDDDGVFSSSWKSMATGLPQVDIRWYGVCSINEGIVVSGGCYNPGLDAKKGCWLLQRGSNQWRALASMNYERIWHTLYCHNSTIYAVGGSNGSESLDSVEIYSMSDESWSDISPMMKPLCQPSVVGVGHRIFALGGRHSQTWLGMWNGPNWSNTLQEYDPLKNMWLRRSDLPEVSGGATAVSFEDKIHVVGGKSRCCMVYHPSSDIWVQLNRPKELHLLAPAVLWKNKIVICGGSAGTSVEEYDPQNDTWSTWKLSLPKALCRHYLLVLTDWDTEMEK